MSKRNTPQRRHTILALLAEQGEVSVDALAQHFATSEVTIRKDLAALEKNGLLLRRYGGAVPVPQELFSEPTQSVSPYKHAIARAGVARIREHQAAGEEVWLLSAATQFVVQPVAEFLGIPCRFTELEIIGQRITGYIVGEACYGPGKVTWAERIARERGVALADCAFYSDSISDLPLLERVGRPVAVNPDRRLERLARARGWVVERFY